MRFGSRRLLSALFCGSLLALASISPSASAQTTAPNQWTWMGGSNTDNQSGVYGTLKTPAAGNIPGTRNSASSWTDSKGHFWLFGGQGYDSSGLTGYLNDLWEFNPTTNEWAWMNGSNTLPGNYAGLPGVYGTLKTPSTSNIPGSRWLAATWTDSSGNLWLFGGNGYDSTGTYGYLNDLWKLDPATLEWTWMGGSSIASNKGVYGTLKSPDTGNIPGGRFGAVTWTDSKGNLWLFGGNGLDSAGLPGELNDLWEFNPSTKAWAWVGGANTANQPAVFGTLGKPDAGNIPPGLEGAVHWIDLSGNLWLFEGTAANGNNFMINTLWEFNPTTSEWAWMGGSNSFPQLSEVFGTLGTPAAGNIPGASAYAASWTDNSGNFWLFGGESNDLWKLNPATTEWTWMGGSSISVRQPGVFGTLGTPAAENIPGSRSEAVSWTDTSGNFWLFGGSGIVANNSNGQLNDLWKYQPSSTSSFAATPVPVISPATGAYLSIPTVTITDSLHAAAIFLTLDGTTPTTSSGLYQGGFGLPETYGKPITVSAMAVASNFFNSPVVTATYTLIPDFSIQATLPSLTIKAGDSAFDTINVTSINGFNGAVSFSCTSGLPVGATCSFSPPTVTPVFMASTTLTVHTTATSTSIRRNPSPLFPVSALAVAFCCIGLRKRHRLQMLLLVAVSIAGLGLFTGCGGGGSSGGGGGGGGQHQPVISTVTVTGTSGSLSHTTTFTLTVN